MEKKPYCYKNQILVDCVTGVTDHIKCSHTISRESVKQLKNMIRIAMAHVVFLHNNYVTTWVI